MTSVRAPGIPRWVGARTETVLSFDPAYADDGYPAAAFVCATRLTFPHRRRARAWAWWLLLTRRGGDRAAPR